MAPYLVCDPYTPAEVQPTEFEIYMDGAVTPTISLAQSVTGGVRCHHDLVAIATGSHRVTVKAVRVDAQWGRLTGPSSVPLDFVRPANPRIASGLALETT
jgi:hypothetical protein